MSILFIIARGIEFGDLKSQQWLTSIISGLFSSIFLTEPIKVTTRYCISNSLIEFVFSKIICLSIFIAFFCRKDHDREASEYIDENNLDLDEDEEYLHTNNKVCLKN